MQSPQSNQGSGAFLFGALLGGTIGAVIGILKAPRSGEETRRMLVEQGLDVYSKAEQSVIGERPADALAEGRAIAQQRRLDDE